MKYAIIASTFSGNKGAASMLEASIQTIRSQDKQATFTVFTVYPEADQEQGDYWGVKILGAKPLFLGLVLNPLALLYKIFPPLRPLLRRHQHIKTLAETDVLLDQGGITFVDGRGKFLLYNVATILPALFMNIRVIKCSQAMGPFSGINRLVAKLILPRIDTICARGNITYKYLKGLGLKNVIEATDYAFLLEITPDEKSNGNKALKKSGYTFGKPGKSVGLLPSEVLRKKAEASGADYIEYNVEFTRKLLEQDYHVLLVAYSARAGKTSRHNNDLPVCRDIASRISHANFTFIDDELSAQQLRCIIDRLDIIVTSRFHAMVAALSVATPPLVVGWSHKYTEVMDMFGFKESALGYDKLDQEALWRAFRKVTRNKKEHENLIKKKLPSAKGSASKQVEKIIKAGSLS